MVVLRRQLAFVQPFAGVVAFVCGIVLGMAKACPNCKSSFFLCGSCDRNHWYCSAECSEAARRLSMRRSARKYKTTSSGREVQRAAQAKYRASLRRRARSALDAALSLGAVTPISTTVASSDEGDAGSAGCAEQLLAGPQTMPIVDGYALRVNGAFSVSHQSSAISMPSLLPEPQPMAREDSRHDKTKRACRVCGRFITHIIEGRRFPKRRRPGR